MHGILGLLAASGAASEAVVHDPSRAQLVLRVGVAFGLTYLIGFEREIRGSAAGDRTFSLVGVGAAVIGFLALHNAPNALAGVVTGVGFIGAGVIIHGGNDLIRGVTTAATIFVAAAVGAACGQGQLLLGAEATVIALLILEIRHSRLLRVLDGRRWAPYFNDDPNSEPLPKVERRRRRPPGPS